MSCERYTERVWLICLRSSALDSFSCRNTIAMNLLSAPWTASVSVSANAVPSERTPNAPEPQASPEIQKPGMPPSLHSTLSHDGLVTGHPSWQDSYPAGQFGSPEVHPPHVACSHASSDHVWLPVYTCRSRGLLSMLPRRCETREAAQCCGRACTFNLRGGRSEQCSRHISTVKSWRVVTLHSTDPPRQRQQYRRRRTTSDIYDHEARIAGTPRRQVNAERMLTGVGEDALEGRNRIIAAAV